MSRYTGRAALTAALLTAAAGWMPHAVQAQEFLSIKGNTVNIRAKPNTQSDIAWELIRGYPVQVIERKDDWIKVQDFEGPLGWVHQPLTGTEPHFLVKVDTLNLRAGPGTHHAVVIKLNKYDILQTLEKSGEWAKVRNADGQEGWMLERLAWGW